MSKRSSTRGHTLAIACLLGACSSPNDRAALDTGDAGHTGTEDGGMARAVSFDKRTLHRDFVCEGSALGDLDADGHMDVVAGPRWYPGPDFTASYALWETDEPFDVRGYSNCFFQWVRDLDGDGASDVLVVGFPGEAAYWLENPGARATEREGEWTRHPITDVVDNESPEYVDLVGDSEPELLFDQGGKHVYAAREGSAWTVHPISDDRGFVAFTHGLGAADVDGDGRMDVLDATAWWEQPDDLAGDPVWTRHAHAFGQGGAQMHGYDIDGDGDTDVVATLSAHGYGLAWYEQRSDGSFAEHVIVSPAAPADGASVILHEPHALLLADLDGDGLRDVITGERHWGHVPEGMPDFAAPARLYWFRLTRTASGPAFEPHSIDDDSGVGTQLTSGDIDGDGRTDLVTVNKKGAFVLVQQ